VTRAGGTLRRQPKFTRVCHCFARSSAETTGWHCLPSGKQWPTAHVDGGTPELVKWTLTDHLNTVRDIARYDSETQSTTVVNHLVYDAYGNVTSETNSAVESLFLFTARPFDPDTGLQNNLNRWYDPAVGRWLSEDPIGFAAGDGNLYRYVRHAVTIRADARGLGPIWDAVMCGMHATSAGVIYTSTVVACVTCLVPGEGVGVVDAAQCLGCLGGLPATFIAIDKAIERCEKACDAANVRKRREMRRDLQEKVDAVREFLGLD